MDITTGLIHHECEDHNHILKRMAKHTRDAGHDDIDVRRFDEAMTSDKTDLGHAGLVGLCKQSMKDLRVKIGQDFLSPADLKYLSDARLELMSDEETDEEREKTWVVRRPSWRAKKLTRIIDRCQPGWKP
uniref:Uncharacterized protein n=1 Tax=Branchiostoma floridae TaxID=7739 RepID=C3Y8N8_BRAFL|eukprot:XP_002607465.1 hypothetical protein BRAFLDRAFT_69897 [Branchiostoma floridae]